MVYVQTKQKILVAIAVVSFLVGAAG